MGNATPAGVAGKEGGRKDGGRERGRCLRHTFDSIILDLALTTPLFLPPSLRPRAPSHHRPPPARLLQGPRRDFLREEWCVVLAQARKDGAGATSTEGGREGGRLSGCSKDVV